MADNFPTVPPQQPPMLRPPQAPPFPGGVPNQSGLPPPAVANQYGQAPVNPFTPGGVAAPQFSSMGTPPGPPKMTVPGAVTQGQAPITSQPVQPYRDPNMGLPGVNGPATSLKAATSPFPLGPATSPVAPVRSTNIPLPATPQAPATTISGPTATNDFSTGPATSLAFGQPRAPVTPLAANPTTGPVYGQPVASDIRAKTAVAQFPTPPTSALDETYARQGADTGSRFAQTEAKGWNPSADLRASHLYDYDYKNPNMPGAAPGRQRGTMAQELEKTAAAPAVSAGPDGMKRVDTGKLAMVTAPAVGEVQNQVSKQQAQIDALNAYIKAHAAPHEAEVSQPPPEWSYKPGELSDENTKTDVTGAVPDTSAQDLADKKKRAVTGKQIASAGSQIAAGFNTDVKPLTAPGVQSPYAESDIRAKSNIQPADYRTASFPTPMMPAGARALAASGSGAVQGGATPAPIPYDSAHDRALAAGYAWLAAHGDEAALKHEAPAPQLPAQREMQAAGSYAPKPYWPEAPTGVEAMQSSQYGLPTQQEADMAAIAEEVRRRREGK